MGEGVGFCDDGRGSAQGDAAIGDGRIEEAVWEGVSDGRWDRGRRVGHGLVKKGMACSSIRSRSLADPVDPVASQQV